ncbi:MAG: RNA polymerase ECF-type sigma factor [Cytophagales bacterium]|jgi:RNA polymerase sigma-70 factor (ECF subfamily)|nr:MAG: RNA polymerase ECF-type sigma factor [Cytophagales bacterium]
MHPASGFHKSHEKIFILNRMTNQKIDIELLLGYKMTGDLKIIGELFRRYTTLVYGVCLKYLRDRDEAKDAVMQIFEKLIHTLKTHEVETFKSWLYVSARNHCLMQLRSKKGKFRDEIAADMENQLLLHLEPDEELEENLEKLEKCMEQLVAEQKKCIRLFYIEEKCYKEIETYTGYDFNQVKSFIQNGKRNLKICLEANG